MSQAYSSRNKFETKRKLVVGKLKSGKRRSEENKINENDDVSERRTEKRFSRSSSKDGFDGREKYGAESSDLKRKRVYGERGAEKGGEYKNERVIDRKSASRKGGIGKDESPRRKSSAKDDISEFDRLNRVKFSSSKGGNSGKSEFSEERIRKKDNGPSGGYKGRATMSDGKRSFARANGRMGSENSFDNRIKSKVKTTKRDGNEGSDGKSMSQSKVRDRWPSTRQDGVSDNKLKIKDKTRDNRVSTKYDGDEKSENKVKSQIKVRDRWPSSKHDAVPDSKSDRKGKSRGDVEDTSQKQHSRNNTDPNKQADQRTSNKHEVGALESSTKKKLKSKKYAEENSSTDGPPKRRKKKKKHMGIHPYDISNKRVDDSISIDDKTIGKEVDSDKDTEISKNAQFRSIQPSPSILSFVDENLLGRRRTIDLRRAGYNIDFSTPLDNIPLSTSIERERIEEAVFRNKLEFFAAAKVSTSFPTAEAPEIAFAGRSNVGKSSLLNALTRQWGVVRTSDKPGLTQTINFFKLGPKLCMVDLPGYGFAYAKEEVKDAWEELVKEYVSTRVGLKRVCLLIDTKWGMKPRDQELINLMERSQTKYQIVLTKTDTVFPLDVARRAMQIEETLKANKSVVQPVMMVSSKSGGGIRSLRTVLGKIARFAKL